MEMGIIGLPNVGKSSLFNALTKAGAQASNYPFTTVEPNVGMAPIADKRMDRLIQLYQPDKVTQAVIRFVDIAGLVKGASQGEGLGNKFLSHIREVDALVHVLRCFSSEKITHVMGHPDPKRDLEIIHTELLLADLEQAQRAREKLLGAAKTGDKLSQEKVLLLDKAMARFERGEWISQSPELAKSLAQYQFLTSKKVVYAVNVEEEDLKLSISELEAKFSLADRLPQGPIIPVSVAVESELAMMEPQEAADFLKDLGLERSALERLVQESMEALDLILFFTAGKKEVRAWVLEKGSPAPKAAGKIHSDMEKGFIRAEVFSFEDLQTAGSEQALQAAGKVRLEGKDYIVEDGDIVTIRFSA